MLEPHPPWLYAAFIGLAAAIGTAAFLAAARRAAIPIVRATAFSLACALSGLAVGRLIVLWEQPVWVWSNLLGASFRQPGVIAGTLLGALLWRRVLLPSASFWTIADIGTPAVAIAFAVARIGCFLVGCCFGMPTDLPWSVRFPAGSLAASLHSTLGWIEPGASTSLPVHPLQLYFLLLGVVVAALSLWLLPRRAFDGQVALVGTTLMEGGKAALESLRQPDPSHPTGHLMWISLLLACGAVMVLALRSRRRTLHASPAPAG